jgi:hypothetical protein
MKVNYQAGVNVIGLPIITTHFIEIESIPKNPNYRLNKSSSTSSKRAKGSGQVRGREYRERAGKTADAN